MMMPGAARFDVTAFSDRETLFSFMAVMLGVAMDAMKKGGNIALAGGETPQEIYRMISKLPLAWDKLHFYPTDERFTDDPARRNDKMLRRCLGSDAQVEPLQMGVMPPRLDIAVLGMGEDGHVASLFPGETLLDGGIYRVTPKAAPEPRLTFPISSFIDVEKLYVLFCGEKKWAALSAPADVSTPIGAVLQQRTPAKSTDIFYAP